MDLQEAIGEDTVYCHVFSTSREEGLSPFLTSFKSMISKLIQEHAANYIWQYEPLELQYHQSAKPRTRSYLTGQVRFGDAIADKWLVIWLLREASQQPPHQDLWIRIWDADGECLLSGIEQFRPSWMSPSSISNNRVWIHLGQIKVLSMKITADGIPLSKRRLTLDDAISTIETNPEALIRAETNEADAFKALMKYPEAIATQTHFARATVPRKVAYLLRHCPAAMPAIVDVVYQAATDFNPSFLVQAVDPVTISVSFSKLQYARLSEFRLSARAARTAYFDRQSPDPDEKKASDLGFKVTEGVKLLWHHDLPEYRLITREFRGIMEKLNKRQISLPTNDVLEAWPLRQDSEVWMNVDYAPVA